MNRRLKGALVVLGAIVCSTLAINATDVIQGIDGNLVGLVSESGGVCGKNAVILQLGGRALCIDTYEASAGKDCPVASIKNEIDTLNNLSTTDCQTASVPEVEPWRYVSLAQAQQLCARSGKRLPTNEEWYKAVLGMSEVTQCAIGIQNDGLQLTGASSCTTPSGVHDMVGNVWEWIDAEVVAGQYNNRALPESGYIALVDSNGVILETTEQPSAEYGEDYAWVNSVGVRGMIRGGFYGSRTDAGLFTLNAAVDLDFKTAGVGFRCVKDI